MNAFVLYELILMVLIKLHSEEHSELLKEDKKHSLTSECTKAPHSAMGINGCTTLCAQPTISVVAA